MNEDIHEAANAVVDGVLSRAARYSHIKSTIALGLAENGRQLRRNAVCPCGSGLKFKKCCLVHVKAKVAETAIPYQNARIERFSPYHGNNNQTELGEGGTAQST